MPGKDAEPPSLQVEPTKTKDFGPCPCCGGNSRTVWGFVHRGNPTEAVYYVQWTLGQVARHGAHIDLIIGSWGDESSPKDRVGVSLEFRRTERGPEFMVIDASSREKYFGDLAAQILSRTEVIGTPIAQRAFEIVDAIWVQDDRIIEITAHES